MKSPKLPLRLFVSLLSMVLVLSACTGFEQPQVVVEPETLEQGQTEPAQVTDQGQQDDQIGVAGVVNVGDVLITSTSLTDYDFENRDGEVSGEIEDVIIDLATGDVLYTTVEYGGFLDIGDTELPMPLSAFAWGPDGQLVLNFDEQTLDSFPDLGTDWLDPSAPGWDDEVGGFWRGIGVDPGFDYTEPTNTIARATDIVNLGIGDVGVGAGTVDDMLIDLGQSKVEYVLLAYDASAFNDELVAVPFDAFDISAVGEQWAFRSGVDADVLQNAPRFSRDALTVGDAATFGEVDQYWGDRGFGVGTSTGGVTTTDLVQEDQPAAVQLDQSVTTDSIGITGANDFLVRASALLGYNVNNLAGENIGEIDDLLIDVETGQILFATLEYGGFLDLGDRRVPIPLAGLSWLSDGELALNIQEQQLESLPDLDSNWPNVADPTWNDSIVNYWTDLSINPGNAASDSQTIMYVSNLIGYDLGNVDAQGSINDLLIDLSQGRAVHVIIDYGGLFDDNLTALPFSAVDVSVEGDAYVFTPNVDMQALQNAPSLNRDAFEQDQVFDNTVDDQIVGYWEGLGYTYDDSGINP